MAPDAYQRGEATKSELAMGHAAPLTPCPRKRRRIVAESPAQPTRPDWADASAEGDRGDIWDFEKKMVAGKYYNLGK